MHPRLPSGWTSLLLLLLLPACHGHIRVVSRPLPDDLKVSALAVYPVTYRFQESPDRGPLVAQRLVDEILDAEGTRLAVMGPGEFKVLKADSDEPWAATDLLLALRDEQLEASETLVLRPWAERRSSSSQQERWDAAGRSAVGHADEVTWVAHLDILSPARAQAVVELVAEHPVDPFARGSNSSDPTPELTALFDELIQHALTLLRPRLKLQPGTLASPRVRYVPPLSAGAQAGGPGLEAELHQLSNVELLNPRLSEQQATTLASQPPGLFVEEPLGGFLQRGDVILLLNGNAAPPQRLVRAFRAGRPCVLQVQRGKDMLEHACR